MRRDLTPEEIEAILDRAYDPDRPRPDQGPRATHAWYDEARNRVMVEFDNDCLFAFPVSMVPLTEGAPPMLLEQVEVEALGGAVGWRCMNTGIDLRGLLLKAFRVQAWAARFLGSVTSEAKAEAARRNGRKGGRPRKKKEPEAAD